MTTLVQLDPDPARCVCLGWILSRVDGVSVRLTDHDCPLPIDGEIFAPGAAVEASSFTRTSDLSPGHASIRGALSSEALTEADIRSGAWDGVRIDVVELDWQARRKLRHVWSGRFRRIEWTGASFEAELVSLKVDLDRLIGRRCMRTCDAELGDARCGVDLTAPGLVGAVCDQRLETCRERFGNAANFRGFPHMPGNDFVLAGPAGEVAE